MSEMKKLFKSVDKSMLLSSVMPAFNFFTRVRLRCGNRDEVLRLGRKNEIEEVIVRNITDEARETAWARSSRLQPGRLPGFSLDRLDHVIRNEILNQLAANKQLLDKQDIKSIKRRNQAKRLRKRERRQKQKTNRGRRSNHDSSTVIVELRLLEFPTAPQVDLSSAYAANRVALRHALIAAFESGKLDSVAPGGLLRRIEMTSKDEVQDRCMNGEVIRRTRDDTQFCVQCPRGTYQRGMDCLACQKGTYQSRSGQLGCLKCPRGLSTEAAGSKSADECKR